MLALIVAMAPPGHGGVGTEFWAELSTSPDRRIDLTVAVGNPDPVRAASVTIETEAGVVSSGTVPPRGSARFDLSWTRQASGSVLARLGYRVRSDLPIHAYQWSCFDQRGDIGVAILVDRRHWGREYLVLAEEADDTPNRTSLLTVVAASATSMEITPSADVQAGPGVPALAAGVPARFDLDAFDVLQLASVPDRDLTGTSITASAPVQVFAGCQQCIVPGTTADQVQEWLPPLDLWSTVYPAVSGFRATGSANHWRVLASEDGTLVTTDPVQPGTPVVLGRGEWHSFQSPSNFEVRGSAPILVGRYTGGGTDQTDSSMTLMLPPEHFATGAIVPLSTFFPLVMEWVDVVATGGANVEVNGTPIPVASFQRIGATGFFHAFAWLDTSVVAQTVSADVPVGIYVSVGGMGVGASCPAAIELPPNLAPSCDAGGPYDASCQGPVSRVRLSGAGSSDPEAAPLTYAWSSPSPGIAFDVPTSVAPEIVATGLGTFDVRLEVSDGWNVASCATTVTITGVASTPPELDRRTTQLWVARRGPDLLFSWQDLGGALVEYNFYEGSLTSFWSHVPARCGVSGSAAAGGRRETTLPVATGSVYYQVSASNCFAEGPTGGDPALSTCPP